MRSNSNRPSSVLLLAAVLTVIWGTNWVLFPLAVREVSVWTFRMVCVVGSGVLILAVAKARGLSLHVPRGERLILGGAALTYLVVWNVASTYAAVLLPSGQAAVLAFTMPMWATLFSWIFLKEQPSIRLMLGIALASCGVGLLAYGSRDAFTSAPLGFAVGISAAIGWAAGTLMLKRAQLTTPLLVSTGWQLLVAGVPITVVAFVSGTREFFIPSWQSLLVISYITLIPMALGNVLWFQIVSRVPPSVSGLSAVMVPIVAMLTGAIVRGEPLGPLQVAAMITSAVAMGLVLLKKF